MTWWVSQLAVSYGGRRALTGVSLQVSPGSIAAVVGADGAGKTTLLRVLAGALDPDRGDVRRPAPEQIGFVSATSAVYTDLTVAENLAFAARAYRVRDARSREAELLAITGLASARDRLGGHLSGGMRQKLGVAMATIHHPEVLILDEPTTGLDPVSRVEIWGMLAGAAADGAAVLVSTVYLAEAERASHVLVLHEGQPLVSGSADNVVAAVPGLVLEADARPERIASWRRGRVWHAWSPDRRQPPGTRIVHADLEDAVIVAALGQEAA